LLDLLDLLADTPRVILERLDGLARLGTLGDLARQLVAPRLEGLHLGQQPPPQLVALQQATDDGRVHAAGLQPLPDPVWLFAHEADVEHRRHSQSIMKAPARRSTQAGSWSGRP